MKKLRNLSKTFIVLLVLIMTAGQARSEELSDFDTFPATIILNAKTYSGFLISDLEYDRYFKLDVEYNSLLEKYNILVDYKNFLEPKFDEVQKKVDDSYFKIQKLAFKQESWFDRNKTWIFLTGGIIIGSLGTYLILDGVSN